MELLGESVLDSIECFPKFAKREAKQCEIKNTNSEICCSENDAAKLDAVLDSVNKLIESLNLEIEKVPSPVRSSEINDVGSELVIGRWSGKPIKKLPALSSETGADNQQGTNTINFIQRRSHADGEICCARADVTADMEKQSDDCQESRSCGVYNELSEVAEASACSPFARDVIVFTKTDNRKTEESIIMEYEHSTNDKSSREVTRPSFTPDQCGIDSEEFERDLLSIKGSPVVTSKNSYMKKQYSETKLKSVLSSDKHSLSKKNKRVFSLGSFFLSSLSGDSKNKTPSPKNSPKNTAKFFTKVKKEKVPNGFDESWFCFNGQGKEEDFEPVSPKKKHSTRSSSFQRSVSLDDNNPVNRKKLTTQSLGGGRVKKQNSNNTAKRMQYHLLKSDKMRGRVSNSKEKLFLDDGMKGTFSFFGENESRMLDSSSTLNRSRHSAADVFSEQSIPEFTARRATMDSMKNTKLKMRANDLTRKIWTKSLDKRDTGTNNTGPYDRSPKHSLNEIGKARSFALGHSWDSESDESFNEHPRAKYETNIQRHYSDRIVKFHQPEDGAGETERMTRLNTVKNKFIKSLKNQMPVLDADELAERTWVPDGECTWSNMSGRKMVLGTTKLHSLSELECEALKRVAFHKLNEIDLGVTIVIPKDESKIQNRKMSMKKKYAVHLSARDKNKEKDGDHVFGIPLINVVENDQLLRLQKSASFANSLDVLTSQNQNAEPNHGSPCSSNISSSTGSLTSITPKEMGNGDQKEMPVENGGDCLKIRDNVFANDAQPNSPTSQTRSRDAARTAKPLKRRGAIAADSLNDIDPYQSQLLEALSLSVSGATQNQRKEKKRSLLPPTMLQVPYVVQKCCDHITKYGLDITGIFRVAGSKKRARQLREEFDRGFDVKIDEDYNPHDVAALLKEFFRDLPEALMTRELYPAFIQVIKLPKPERIPALRNLVWLLPSSNRDTLQTLLNFLSIVAARAETIVDQAGKTWEGNKMSVGNLATIFGPNILHRYKKSQASNDNQYQVQSLDKAEDSSAVITVVEEMILNQSQLFQIPKKEHDHMLRILKESDPEAVDFLLRRKAANHMREKSKLLTKQFSEQRELISKSDETINRNSNNNSEGHLPKSNAGDYSDIGIESCNPNDGATEQGMLSKDQQDSLSTQEHSAENKIPKERLKFKRSNIKKNIHLNNYSDLEERSESGNSRNSSETEVQKKEERFNMPPEYHVEPRDTNNRISTSSIFSMPPQGDRTMSFTEDDMQDILSPNSSPIHQHLKPPAIERPDSCGERRDSKEVVSGAQSSDSGISIECSTPNIVTTSLAADSPGVKRRGGFSIRQEENQATVNDKLNRALAGDIVSLENDIAPQDTEHNQHNFTSRIKMKFNPNTNQSNNNTPRTRRSSQVIRLCHNTTLSKKEDPPFLCNQSNDSENAKLPEERVVRKRLPSSLSPRVHRQYIVKESKLQLQSMINTNKQLTKSPRDSSDSPQHCINSSEMAVKSCSPERLEPTASVVRQRHARHTKHASADKTKSDPKNKATTFQNWYDAVIDSNSPLPETSV